ncbi:hypoxia-responsive family protein [Actinidia rufa]|uniref:Hypoxia-responsive family protein n=1 Tax=Actinidia rufa TaxID=165716 RepID=A0A7J0FCN2_9ERIC|nr:hypoxia-responsive family protein [Actinidia rufa]
MMPYFIVGVALLPKGELITWDNCLSCSALCKAKEAHFEIIGLGPSHRAWTKKVGDGAFGSSVAPKQSLHGGRVDASWVVVTSFMFASLCYNEVVAIVDLTILHGCGRLIVGSKYGRGGRRGTVELLVVGSYVVFLPGAFMTAGVLAAGLISFKRGNSQLGQQLMRARVVVQGATVALMVGTAYYYGDKF